MTQRSRPRGALFRRILSTGLVACFAASGGCHRSTGQDEADGGVDAGRTDSGAPDARVRDTAVEDTATFDGGFDSGFDAGIDAPPTCPEPSLVESFHPEADETRYGRALALSADGTTLAVSSQDSLSIYDRDEDGWLRVYRRDVIVTAGRHASGGVDIDNAGDIVIWGSSVTTESSPDYSAALVFVREARGEWGETRIEQAPDTFGDGSGVSISGDGSTLAVREDRGGSGVILRLFERREGEGWLQSQTLEASLFGSPVDSKVELSESGDRVAWHSSEHFRVDVYRKEPSGEWTLELEVSDFGPVGFAFDAAGERLVLRGVGPDAIVVFDRVGTTWSQSAHFPATPGLVVPAPIAISPSGQEIYVGRSAECGVEVLRWSERGADWVQQTSQQTGVRLDTIGPPYVQFLTRAAGDGTVALSIPDDRFNGERTPPEAVGVYLVR